MEVLQLGPFKTLRYVQTIQAYQYPAGSKPIDIPTPYGPETLLGGEWVVLTKDGQMLVYDQLDGYEEVSGE